MLDMASIASAVVLDQEGQTLRYLGAGVSITVPRLPFGSQHQLKWRWPVNLDKRVLPALEFPSQEFDSTYRPLEHGVEREGRAQWTDIRRKLSFP